MATCDMQQGKCYAIRQERHSNVAWVTCPCRSHVLQGVDFFFSKRSHAQRFLDFLQGVVPLRYRTDKQLVSHNEQNASYNYKYTFSVEIVPICKVCTVLTLSLQMSCAEHGHSELLVNHMLCILCMICSQQAPK